MINDNEKSKNNKPADVYMGNLTSHQIGMMAKSGQLGGEMVRRMVQNVEQDMTDGTTKPQDLV